MSAIPKPITTRLAHSLKQLMHKNAVHGQQIINMQTQMAALPDFPAAAVAAPEAAESTYDEVWAASVTTAVTDLITALQNAGVIAS